MTLADFSAFVRSSLKWFLVSLVALFILWLVWVWINGASQLVFKPKGEDTAYGKIAAPFFVKTYSSLTAGSFKLSTSLPTEKEKIPVYQTVAANKFSDDQIEKIANFFGLTKSSQKKAGDTLTWGSTTGTALLKLNTSQSHFAYKYNFSQEGYSFNERISFDEKAALEKAKGNLLQLGLLPPDISKGTYSFNYFKISEGGRQKTSASSANALEIAFFRKVGDFVSSGEGSIKFLFGPSFKILQLDYYYSPLDPVGSPYPITSSQQAWQNFQNGKAFVATGGNFDSVTVMKITLSYWESTMAQNYLQPIWVFSGTGEIGGKEENFTAYMPAIASSFLAQ